MKIRIDRINTTQSKRNNPGWQGHESVTGENGEVNGGGGLRFCGTKKDHPAGTSY